MYKFDCIIIGKKLKSGTSTVEKTGEVRPWTEVYTPDGNVVRISKYDSSSLPDMAEVQLHCLCRLYKENMYISFIKAVK